MKTIIISPGWNQSSNDTSYDFIAKAYEGKGYQAMRYSPQWNGRTMTDWVDGLIEMIDKAEGDVALWGFSLGAMASLTASTHRRITSLVLCSPSGYFKEYLPLIDSKYLSQWNDRQLSVFESLSFVDIADKVRVADSYVLAGELELEEWPAFRKVVDDLKATGKFKVSIIKEAHHDFSAPNYRLAISEAVGNLK